MKFKIVKKSKYAIELVSTTKEKQPLIVGYKKSILFLQINAKGVGEEVEVDVAQSDKSAGYSGNLYATDNNAFLTSMQEAKMFLIKEKQINALLAQGTV
jgi:hypothetical protein